MFDALKRFIAKVAAFFKSDEFKKDLDIAREYVPLVLPIVKQVAAITANPFDDAAIEFIERTTGYAATPNPGAMEGLVKVAVRTLARKAYPGLEVPDRVLDTAIQIAYLAFRRGA